MKSGNLNFLEPSGPLQACNGTAFFDCASLNNLVNKANLVHSFFLVYLSIPTCFGRLCAHHQEKQLCLCGTWYLLFCADGCLVCRVHTRQALFTTQTQSSQWGQIILYQRLYKGRQSEGPKCHPSPTIYLCALVIGSGWSYYFYNSAVYITLIDVFYVLLEMIPELFMVNTIVQLQIQTQAVFHLTFLVNTETKYRIIPVFN